MSEDKCPFCGAEKYDNPEIAYGKFKCGTLDNDPLPRFPECWRQWALNLQAENEALKAKVEKLERVVWAARKLWSSYAPPKSDGTAYHFNEEFGDVLAAFDEMKP